MGSGGAPLPLFGCDEWNTEPVSTLCAVILDERDSKLYMRGFEDGQVFASARIDRLTEESRMLRDSAQLGMEADRRALAAHWRAE